MSKRQIAMVMDLNKCLGCHTCSIACKTLWTRQEGMEAMWWNSVNTAPGKGTPKNWEEMGGGFKNGKAQPGQRPTYEEYGKAWDFDFDKMFYGGDRDAALLPEGGDPDWGANWDEDVGAGEHPHNYFFYIPRICNHCTDPACMNACPRGAIFKRDEDGIVLINEDRCRGHRFCQEACPYKKIYYNVERDIGQKCIFCLPRVEQGVATACARQCPGRVRFLGYRDDAEGPIHKLVDKHKIALPLHPEYGTQPNVFYVPPMAPPDFDEAGDPTQTPRIPLAYLKSLFGDEVERVLDVLDKEREKTARGEKSEIMDLLISRKWLDMFGPFTRQPKTLAGTAEHRIHWKERMK